MTADLPGDPTSTPSSMGRDVATAYVATASKIGSWVVVSAVVYRLLGPGEFALLALIRGTIGLLNYISLGLAPALIHESAHAPPAALEQPSRTQVPSAEVLYSNALVIAGTLCLAGAMLAGLLATSFDRLFRMPMYVEDLPLTVCFMGFGLLARLLGDAPGAMLQIRSRIAMDNLIIASADLAWAGLATASCFLEKDPGAALATIAIWYTISGGLAFTVRLFVAGRITGIFKPDLGKLQLRLIRQLLGYGIVVVLAQIADYLYAPTDYILIDRLLYPIDIANYAPAVQIDSGLLLLVTGLSAVLLPKAAIAHGSGDARTVRKYYLVGTFASFVLLAIASAAVWVTSPWIFRLWLGNPMPVTQSILPIVLLNTVIGGSSAVGRSILLAVGRVRPFTIAVLIAGVTNVVCSYAFVRFFHWGLRGIVLGTVVAVVGRCAIWMPWYVMRTLRAGGLPDGGRVNLG